LLGCGVNLKYFLPLLGYVKIKGKRADEKEIREKGGMEIKIRKGYRNGTMGVKKPF
jgi:hypothetical protein